MHTPAFVCAALLGLAQHVVSHPTVKQRAPKGPKIGGANFPDPAIIGANNRWYAFATRTMGGNVHIQMAESTDFENWSIVTNADGSQKDALPTLPSWVDGGNSNTWAPDVIKLDDGSFMMYYSATTKQDTAKHCIGAAKASSVTGPYKPVSNQALICPLAQGGAIDAAVYNDNGQRWITWKVDGNSIGHGGACGNTVAPIVPTPLRVQRLSASGTTLLGSATTILDNEGASDEGIIEAPDLVHHDGTWFLFFSANCYVNANYNVHYATSKSVTGPYTRAAKPLFKTGDGNGLTAPGGADVDHDGVHMLFHAQNGNGGRAMYSALLSYDGVVVSA